MSSNKPYRIVVGIDYSSTADLALAEALEIAAERPKSELHAVHVVQLGIDPGVQLETIPEEFARLNDYLAKRVSEWEKSTSRKVEQCFPHVRFQAPASEIAQIAVDLEASLIVIGSHGRRGFERFLLGSVSEKVIRVAPCSVFVVRPEATEAPVVEIAPPCPACLETRKQSSGARFWCEQHSERHGQRHTYHYESKVSQPTNFPLLSRS